MHRGTGLKALYEQFEFLLQLIQLIVNDLMILWLFIYSAVMYGADIQSKGKEKGLGLVFVFGQCDSMDLVLMFEMFGCLL